MKKLQAEFLEFVALAATQPVSMAAFALVIVVISKLL